MSNKFFSKKTIREYIEYTQPKAHSFTVLVADSIEVYNYLYFKNLPYDEAIEKAKSVGRQYAKAYERVSLSTDQTVNVIQSSRITSKVLLDIKDFVTHIYNNVDNFNKSVKKDVINSIGSKAGIANHELVPETLCKYKIGEISLSVFMYQHNDVKTVQVSRCDDEVLYSLYKKHRSHNETCSIQWEDFEYLIYDPWS